MAGLDDKEVYRLKFPAHSKHAHSTLMAKKPYWIDSGKFTLLQRVSMLAFGVLTFYLLVRMLDKEGYGVWMLFLSVSALLDTARAGFLKNPLIRYLNTIDPEEKKNLQASSFAMNVLFSILSSTILVLGAGWLSASWDAPQITVLFYIYFFTNLLCSVFYHCEYLQIAHFRFKGPFWGYFLKSGLFSGCVAFFYFTDYTGDVVILSYCYLVTTLVATAVMVMFSYDLISFRVRFKATWLKELFSYGKYTLGTNISAVFMRNIDLWMLGWFISPAAVAVYNVAIRVANLFEVPLMALASVMFPQAVKKAEEEGESAMKELYEKSVSLILMMTTPMVILVLIFSDEIVWLLTGDGYEEAAMVLNVTMLYGLIMPFNKQMGILLDAIGKARLNMFFVAGNAILNCILNALLIPTFGVIGAAYATLFSMLTAMIVNQIYLRRTFAIEIKNLLHYSRYYFVEIRKRVFAKLGH